MPSCEQWKPIEGYEGIYEVSNLGRVRSYKNGKWGIKNHPTILRGQKGKHYKNVVLCRETKKSAYIHHLVASAFVPNPNKYTEINHIDGDKLNNSADNLEWCTHLQNMKHAAKNGLAKFNGKEVICTDTGKIYKTATEASNETGISRRAICNCVNGISKTAGKMKWLFYKMGEFN